MRDTVKAFCLHHNMLLPGDRVLAAVSGGRDSVCMLMLLHSLSEELGFSLCAAHFNHCLRGAESEGDEAFTVSLCRSWGIDCLTGRGEVAAEAARACVGTEEAARRMRYAFLLETAEKTGCTRIATAHNADDNAETVLMNLLRGSGTKGLCGIPPVRDKLIRPMLCISRADIDGFLEENEISYRNDSSNDTDFCTRNRLRHRVMPLLREEAPDVCEKIFSASSLLREDDQYLTSLAEAFLRTEKAGVCHASGLLALPKPVASRAVRLLFGEGLSRRQVENVLALAENSCPSAELSLPGVTVCRENDLLRKREEPVSFAPFSLAPGDRHKISELGLAVSCDYETSPENIHKSFTTFWYHSDTICGTILVRPRKTGDSISLSGRGCTKSLKKLMIEEHIPASRREQVPVIADEKGLLAVFGLGADERCLTGKGPFIRIRFEEIEEYE